MSEEKKVRLTIVLPAHVEELLRNHFRRKGDISRIITELLVQKFMPEVLAEEARDEPTFLGCGER